MGWKTWLGLKKRPKMAGSRARPQALEWYALNKAKEDNRRFRTLFDAIRPMRAEGYGKVRIGGANDGGYVMLDDFDAVSVAFSCGIGNDCSWDLAVAERGIPVHQFDPTIDAPPTAHPLFTFHQLAVSGAAGPERITVSGIASLAEGRPAILKIDIAGNEWEPLDAATGEDLKDFTQIVIEFHDLTKVDRIERYERVFRRLSETHQCVHVHGNNCAAFSILGGVPVPDVLEVTFARRGRYGFVDTDEMFPTEIDRPNFGRMPDYWLGSFRFS